MMIAVSSEQIWALEKSCDTQQRLARYLCPQNAGCGMWTTTALDLGAGDDRPRINDSVRTRVRFCFLEPGGL